LDPIGEVLEKNLMRHYSKTNFGSGFRMWDLRLNIMGGRIPSGTRLRFITRIASVGYHYRNHDGASYYVRFPGGVAVRS